MTKESFKKFVKDGIVQDCVRDPDGNLFEIKNLIAFGNKVEP